MTFRIEEKLLINKNQIYDFKRWMQMKGAKVIFPSRKIESLYFDNNMSQMYADSEEGCLPRKKIRVRNYPNKDIQKFNLEVKISSVEGRYKNSTKIEPQTFNNIKYKGYKDLQYGICFPKLIVRYNREYYKIIKERITIDYNIEYCNYFDSSKIYKKDDIISVEIKTGIFKSIDELLNNFPFQRTRLSKYCRGYKALNIR